MYARSTTVWADLAALEDGIAYVRDEVMPAVIGLEDCLGLSMLVDRESGQCIVTSSWRTEDAMNATDLHLSPMRRRGGEILGGTPRIDAWEVAVMHRDHQASEGVCCRVTWLRLERGNVDRALEVYRMVMLPEMETLDGFRSASLLVNRAAGRACSTTTYASWEALASSRHRAWALRERGVRDAGVDVADVVECDLVLAHLHLPELV